MGKLRLLLFFAFIILCCLFSNNFVGVICKKVNKDVYRSTLKGLNLSRGFIKAFDDKNVRETIEKYFIEEHLKYYISNTRKSENSIIKAVEKTLLKEYPITIGSKENIFKNELLKFLSVLFSKEEEIVKTFLSDFTRNSIDIGVKYRNFENKFYEEYENIENLKKTYRSTVDEINDILNSTKSIEEGGCGVYFIEVREDVLAKVTLLKEIITKLKDKISILYNLNYGLNEFKHDMDVYVSNYQSEVMGGIKGDNNLDVGKNIDASMSSGVISKSYPAIDEENSTQGIPSDDSYDSDDSDDSSDSGYSGDSGDSGDSSYSGDSGDKGDGRSSDLGENGNDNSYRSGFSSRRIRSNDMISLLEGVMMKLIFSLRTKISSTRDEVHKKLTAMEKELIDLSNEITRREMGDNMPKLSIVKNNFLNIESIRSEYEDYVRKITKVRGENINGEANTERYVNGNYNEFEKILTELEKHAYWVKEQDAFSYCEREDISKILKICQELVEKLKKTVIYENFNLLMIYENLYKELNKFLYDEKCSTNDNTYLKAWNSLEKYEGSKILIDGVDRLLRMISILTQMIKLFKGANKNMNADAFFNLNRLSNGFYSAGTKINLFKFELVKLIHNFQTLHNIKNNIEKFGHIYKENITRMDVMMNSFNIASENLHIEIDTIIQIVSNRINIDFLINEFKKVRSIWKKYVKSTIKTYNEKNQLISVYVKDKNIIFPPSMRLGTNAPNFVVKNGISKTALDSPYFVNLYRGVINKFDSIRKEKEMKEIFSIIYRTMDIVINMVKQNGSILKKQYSKKRKEILNLINYRRDSQNDIKKIHEKLIGLEEEIVKNLQHLFMNKVNLNKQVENSVELLKTDMYKDKLPSYCLAVEAFIQKYFITIGRWKSFLSSIRKEIPSKLVRKNLHNNLGLYRSELV
ncbi:conserved Plasmodium protein, unknown function [Plasmodium ovale]|uniref:Uncharacterized protein n=2 Tax=Plasmodium ovale TaxID=36330 RepID=A0A1A8W9E8_PLAOA|nr:conserved Plasmodium protein, unknown function [Plasmodium ovale curtisi]SBS97811.1 conserved Plasmodium protein, unknown function [Plasmodium ovale curtisi]SCP06361.1 conserved Plasmodium protein, unknown function [Plasmodium ovale]